MAVKITQTHCIRSIAVLVVVLFEHPVGIIRASSLLAVGKHFSNVYKDNLNTMSNMIDEDYEPCEDFFQHACGYFDPSGEYDATPFLYNKENRVRFFEENRSAFSTNAGILLRDLYDSCKYRGKTTPAANSYVGVAVASLQQFPDKWSTLVKEIDFLSQNHTELKNWPFLRYQWEQANITMTGWSVLAANAAVHGVPIFVEIFFAANTIFIGPADIVCPSENAIKETLMHSVAKINPQIAEIISSELSVFCRELAGLLPISEEQQRIDDANPVVDDTMAEYFSTFFGRLNFTKYEIEEARKIQLNEKRLREILAVIRNSELRIVINYIIWKLNVALRYEDCFQLTTEFETLLLAEYWHWGVFEPLISKDVAMATYLYHTTRFQKRRKETLIGENWSLFVDKRLPKKDYNLERAIKKYANSELAPEMLDTIYGGHQFRGKFHANLFRMRAAKLRQSFFEDIIDEDDINHSRYFVRQFLDFVLLILKQPLYHYFSTQGFDLWMHSNYLYNADGYYMALDCLDRQTEVNLDDEWSPSSSSIFDKLTPGEVEQIYKFHRAFSESYRDYQFWLEGESFSFAEDYVLEYVKMTSQQIMFYSVAQLYCGRNDNKYRTLINRSFMNMPEFQEAFVCPSDAPMNPPAKCVFRDCLG